MMNATLDSSLAPEFRKFMPLFAALDGPILDAPCGYGRHARALQELGCRVTCADVDDRALEQLTRLNKLSDGGRRKRLQLCRIDLVNSDWPFKQGQFSGALNVHFYDTKLLTRIAFSLASGGLLYVETIANRKGNFMQLPEAGEVEQLLRGYFDFIYFKERHAGPTSCNKVTLRMFARRI